MLEKMTARIEFYTSPVDSLRINQLANNLHVPLSSLLRALTTVAIARADLGLNICAMGTKCPYQMSPLLFQTAPEEKHTDEAKRPQPQTPPTQDPIPGKSRALATTHARNRT